MLAMGIVLLVLALANPARADEPAATPLQQRAQALLDLKAPGSVAERVTRSDSLVAMADSLELARDLATASRLLEKAGMFSFHAQDLSRARSLWDRGLAMARASGDPQRVPPLLNSVAVGTAASGDLEGGARRFAELVEVRRELGDERGEGIAWGNLVNCYTGLNRVPEALQSLRQARRLHAKVGNQRGVIVGFLQQAELLAKLGDFGTATEVADSALALARDSDSTMFLGRAWGDKARYLNYTGQHEASLATFDSALVHLEPLERRDLLFPARVNQADALLQSGHEDRAYNALQEIELEAVGESEAVAVLHLRGAALAALSRLGPAEEVLTETVSRLEELRARQESEESAAGITVLAGRAYSDLALVLLRQGRTEEAWEVAERGSGAVLRQQLSGSSRIAELPNLQGSLGGSNAVLLHFTSLSFGHGAAFVVSSDSLVAIQLAIPSSLRPDLQAAAYLMAQGEDDGRCQAALERVAKAVLAPVSPALGDAERLILVPGPSLAGFPLETLPLASGTSLGERYAVTYAPSATTHLGLAERVAPQDRVVAFAAPDVEAQPQGAVLASISRRALLLSQPLPEARKEVESIAPEATLLVGKFATRQAFLDANTRSASVLHFATHALVDPLHDNQAALVLAGQDQEVALLEAAEIREQPVQSDLVTLSGCSTGGGFVYPGEGSFGLVRAFFQAGARSVVMSLWDVEDRAARRFMEHFYGGLRLGMARDQALRAARASMKDEGFPHRDRSAFVLAGVGAEPVAALAGVSVGRPMWQTLVAVLVGLLLGAGIMSVILRR